MISDLKYCENCGQLFAAQTVKFKSMKMDYKNTSAISFQHNNGRPYLNFPKKTIEKVSVNPVTELMKHGRTKKI